MTGISVDGHHDDLDEELGFGHVCLTARRLALVVDFAVAAAGEAMSKPELGIGSDEIDRINAVIETVTAEMEARVEEPQPTYLDLMALYSFCKNAEDRRIDRDAPTFDALTAFYEHVEKAKRQHNEAETAKSEAPRPAA